MQVAITYCYLAWITYCYRRGLDQGTQLDDDVAAMAEAAAEGMRANKGLDAYGSGGGGRGASGGYGSAYAGGQSGETEIPVRARLGEVHGR